MIEAPSDSASNPTACVGPHSGPVVDQSDFENRINLMYTNSPDRGCISFADYDFTPRVSDYTALSEIDKRHLASTVNSFSGEGEFLSSVGYGTWEEAMLSIGLTTDQYLYSIFFDCACGLGMSSPTVLAGKMIGQLNWSNVDLTGANVSSLRLTNVDLSSVRGLSVSQLNSGMQFWGATLPEMDLTGFDPSGKYLSNVDFRNTTELTTAMLARADGAEVQGYSIYWDSDWGYVNAIRGIKYPAMDIGSLSLVNRDVASSDFSLVTGLTTGQLNTAIPSYSGVPELINVIFPSMTISGLNPNSRLEYADMSRVLGLTLAEYNSYVNKTGLILPIVRAW